MVNNNQAINHIVAPLNYKISSINNYDKGFLTKKATYKRLPLSLSVTHQNHPPTWFKMAFISLKLLSLNSIEVWTPPFSSRI